jgi:hypothetical protein
MVSYHDPFNDQCSHCAVPPQIPTAFPLGSLSSSLVIFLVRSYLLSYTLSCLTLPLPVGLYTVVWFFPPRHFLIVIDLGLRPRILRVVPSAMPRTGNRFMVHALLSPQRKMSRSFRCGRTCVGQELEESIKLWLVRTETEHVHRTLLIETQLRNQARVSRICPAADKASPESPQNARDPRHSRQRGITDRCSKKYCLHVG